MSSDSTPTQPLINTYTTSYIPSDVLSSSLQRIPSRKWLVKYFEFNNISGEWNGGQTGFVYLDNTFPSEPPPRLIMTTKNDESSKTIFSFEITNCIEFKTQQDTILTWKSSEDEQQENLAISFLEKEGIEKIKESIEKIKGNNIFTDDEYNEDYIFNTIDKEHLPLLVEKIQPGMDYMFHKIISKNHFFFNQLCALFDAEEAKFEEMKSSVSKDTNDTIDIPNSNNSNNSSSSDNLSPINCLRLIFKIFKNLILTGDADVIKQLLSDKLYLTTFGAFEYDFESQKTWQHRQYFKEVVKFKNILDINNTNILGMIHLKHRLEYLRDTAMGRYIDENTSLVITNIIKQNDNDIINYFILDKDILKKLLYHISNDNDLIMQKNACDMLIELMCAASKDVIKDQLKTINTNIYTTICEYDILTILQGILRKNSGLSNYQQYINDIQHNKMILQYNNTNNVNSSNNVNSNFIKHIEEEIKISAVQIFINILTTEPTLIREYIKNKDSSLFIDLCNLILSQENYGIKWEIDQSIITPMIITENTTIPSLESDDYISTFFNKGLTLLLDYLSVPLIPQYKTEIVSTKQIIIDILIHCIESYGNNIEEWLIKNNALYKVLNAINDKHKVINIYVVKFIKCIILRMNERFYENNLYDILDKVLTMINNDKRRNKEGLLLSAVCDLFLHLKVLKIQKFKEWVHDRNDVLYCEENVEVFKLIFEKGCDGIEGKIKESINNENKSLGTDLLMDDFFRGNDVDDEEFQGHFLGKKTHPSQPFEKLLFDRDEQFMELTHPKSSLHDKDDDDDDFVYDDEIE